MATEGHTSARPRRCASHPAVASVGGCDVCGRALCVSCAVPVRGRLIGPECLSKVLVDPPPQPPPVPIAPSGERLALLGFGLLVITSVFPWSRFGDSSNYFGAWAPHWSLAAAVAGVLGVLLVVVGRSRPVDPRLETTAHAVLAVVAAGAASLFHRNPPLLAESTAWPLFAVAAALIALMGALTTFVALLRARRPPS